MTLLIYMLLLTISFVILRITVKIDIKNDNCYIDEFNGLGMLILIIIMLMPYVNVVLSIVAFILVTVQYYEDEADIEDLFKKIFLIRNKKK